MAKVTASLTGTGSSDSINGVSQGKLALSLSGTWAGTVDLEWSFNGGTTWLVLDSYTANTSKIAESPSEGIVYRATCSAFTSGTIVIGLAN